MLTLVFVLFISGVSFAEDEDLSKCYNCRTAPRYVSLQLGGTLLADNYMRSTGQALKKLRLDVYGLPILPLPIRSDIHGGMLVPILRTKAEVMFDREIERYTIDVDLISIGELKKNYKTNLLSIGYLHFTQDAREQEIFSSKLVDFEHRKFRKRRASTTTIITGWNVNGIGVKRKNYDPVHLSTSSCERKTPLNSIAQECRENPYWGAELFGGGYEIGILKEWGLMDVPEYGLEFSLSGEGDFALLSRAHIDLQLLSKMIVHFPQLPFSEFFSNRLALTAQYDVRIDENQEDSLEKMYQLSLFFVASIP